MSLVEKAIAKARSSGTGPLTPESSQAILEDNGAPGLRLAPMPPPVPSGRTVAVDRVALVNAGLAVDESEQRRLSDQFRRIKRPILDRVKALTQSHSALAQLVMLTSALPGDGKTFSSLNMALSIALERDVSVLLVDADVAKPHVTTVLGLKEEPGLLECIADPSLHAESLVYSTDIPGFSFLPAGHRTDAATELLASARMADVANRLMAVDPRRVILFDSPPLLLSSESRALIQSVGQVVMMVRAGQTPQGAVQEALGHIPSDKLTGIVLNECDIPSTHKHYGYGAYGDNQEASKN